MRFTLIRLFAMLLIALSLSTITYADDLVLSGYDPADNKPLTTKKPKQSIPDQSVIKKYSATLFNDPQDATGGNANGSITMVEFFDYRCAHSAKMIPVVTNILSANPNIKIIYKELPLQGAMSTYIAKAALAAKNQGKYTEFHNELMKGEKGLTEKDVLAKAKNLGIDTTKLVEDMKSDAIQKQLDANKQLAKSIGFNGTPTFFIGTTAAPDSKTIFFLFGEITQKQMQSFIDRA